MEAVDPVVVRGGSLRDAREIRELVLDNADMGTPALSVFVDAPRPDETEEECIERICRVQGIPHGKIQLSSVSRLEAAGFRLTHEPGGNQGPHHYHVHFDVPVEQSQAEGFVASFESPVPNPIKRGKA
ncbi:hypothetical protein [Agrococcus sp. SCSIO52902]|uniref:hypothetical protein n=1 Tax=Agrococcus sp. SCSIO52902 TaxID=2933290 RepID=UPI001FF27087|nr:hypothetical protein [Agrococcus sp. SCSIO52902]UOW01259.1 hypothetical protein MU522_02190 [Agrococcus sp. SCSIO52902]